MNRLPSKKQLNDLLKYYQSGNNEKTYQLASTLIKEFPYDTFAWKILSVYYKKIGKISDSLTAIQKVVNLSPKDAFAHYNLGNTFKDLKQYYKAEESYKKSISLKPDFIEAIYNLGITFKESEKFLEAEKAYKEAIILKPNFANAYNNLGNVLETLGKLNEAEKYYKKAISLKPDFAEAYNNIGALFEKNGQLEDAKIAFENAIKIDPLTTNAHRQLCLLKKFESYDEQYSILKKLNVNKSLSDQQLCNINFSLAKIYEDLENFKDAFKCYNKGNSLQKKLLKYNIQQDIELFNKIKLVYTKIKKNIPHIDRSKQDLIPIFIVGMPRSGTTLLEQIISSHSKVTGLGELPFISQFGSSIINHFSKYSPETIIEFRKNYFEKVKNLSSDNLFFTDKMPQNFRYIGFILAIFPEAKILHIKRDPAAVCWANYKQWFRSKELSYSYSISDIIRYFKLYEDMMQFWEKSFKNLIYQINYEDLTNDPINITKNLIQHLDLAWEEKCLYPEKNKRIVSTASNIQIRKKIYKGSSEQWKKYRPFLDNIFDSI